MRFSRRDDSRVSLLVVVPLDIAVIVLETKERC